jgi:serine/threonine-protein kinase
MPAVDSTQAIPAMTVMKDDGDGPRRRTGAYIALLVGLLALLGAGLFLLAHELGLGSSSASEVTVPAVINQPQDQATTALKNAGLNVKVQSVDNDAAANTVVDQNPKPEAKAHKGDTVTISVSKGPPQVTIPAVVGKTIDDATNDLEQLGLTVVTRAQNSDRPQGEVLDQNPNAGTQVAKNSSVTLTVSSGTGQATVPNVVGQDAANAGNALGQAGFKVSTKTQASDTVQAGTVISTNPAGGAKANKGSTVTMIVSSGPAPTTTEAVTTTTSGNFTATVPDVSGQSRASATSELHADGFSSVNGSNCPTQASVVQSTNPPAGTTTSKSSTIFLNC